MARMFNRDDMGFYGMPALQTEIDRVLATNLQFDHRVSVGRETAFRSICTQGRSDFHNALAEYHEQRVRFNNQPDFGEAFNSANRVATEREHPDTKYVNILDLSGLTRVVDWDPGLRSQSYSTAFSSGPSTHKQFRRWLTDNLHPRRNTEDQQRAFVGQIVRAIGNRCRQVAPHNPIWVAPFEAFKAFLGKPGDLQRADLWQQVLGLNKEPGRWLAVLKYSLAELGRELFRPTQLDAGNYGWHFPSHYCRPVKRGGQAMSLWFRDSRDGAAPIAEYIHVQCDCLNENHVLAVAKTTLRNENQILACRKRHRQRLKDINPLRDDDTWLPC